MVGEYLGDSPRSHGQEERIFVSIRVRPLNEKERARRDVSEWECIYGNTIKFKNSLAERSSSTDAYTFDRVFGDGCSTQQVYEEGVKEVALSVVSGINSTIFAYGQTSSGKTYTMTGITEYAVRDIYDYIETCKDRKFVLKFSAMEIYNESVRDLLSEDCTPLRLLDDPEKGTVVEKLTEEILTEQSQLQELLSVCAAERATEETSMNDTSSRSHQILRLTVESSPRNYVGPESSGTLIASVNFVDLAGSERASQTLSAGARLREGGHINRSLLTLGSVIRKLSKGRNGHIPFRDSKLTRILQNSLGGNARTAIVCTISPARSQVEQSRNTLFFAGCAKQVTTNARVNVVMSDKDLVKQLQRQLARMENELRNFAPSTVLLKERDLQIEQMDKEIRELTRQRDIFQSHVENLLQSAATDQLARADKVSASELSGDASNLRSLKEGGTSEHSDRPRPSVPFPNENHLQQPENPEDNFLLDGNTPEFVGPESPDPYEAWEDKVATADAESEDNCKEVQCVEIREVETDRNDFNSPIPIPEERGGKLPLIVLQNGDDESSSKKDNELSHVTVDHSQEALQQKIQELQRTIDRLVGLSEKSNRASVSHISHSTNLQLARSRSCRPIMTATCAPQFDKLNPETMSHPQFDKRERKNYSPPQSNKLEQKAVSPQFNKLEPAPPPQFDKPALITMLPPQVYKLEYETFASPARIEKDYSKSSVRFQDKVSALKFHGKRRKSSRKPSRTMEIDAAGEAESVLDSDTEDTASVLNFVVRMNEKAKPTPWKKDSDDLVVRARPSGINEDSNGSTGISFLGVPGAFLPTTFERQQRDIVELWDACNVPLVHRSYFFLLIRGEISDSVYLDVELRRLSFLKDTFSSGTRIMGQDGQNLTPNSSLKALNRERKMLSKQVHKKFSRKEREELYLMWRIDLKTKHRSIQLAWRLWTNTKDNEHVRQSAVLVAKLVGLLEPNEAPKKTFGLGFFSRRKGKKSSTWNDTTSTLM